MTMVAAAKAVLLAASVAALSASFTAHDVRLAVIVALLLCLFLGGLGVLSMGGLGLAGDALLDQVAVGIDLHRLGHHVVIGEHQADCAVRPVGELLFSRDIVGRDAGAAASRGGVGEVPGLLE